MGDKIEAKKIAKQNGLPVIEGSEGGIKSFLVRLNHCVKKSVILYLLKQQQVVVEKE